MTIPRIKIKNQANQRFASGRWLGFYEQYGQRHQQDQAMEFADGMVRGDGSDAIGPFRIEGEYRSEAGAVRVGWIKTYVRGHRVLYLGTFDGTAIEGEWSFGGPYPGEAFGFTPVHLVSDPEHQR